MGAGLSSGLLSESVLRILAQPVAVGKLSDIEHVVIFINENRSFDHYFGRYPGVRGFSDPNALPRVFSQRDPANTTVRPLEEVLPFHLDIHNPHQFADCTHDISHEWFDQHRYWDKGLMNRWVTQHNAVDGDQYGFLSMGYYEGSPARDGSGDIDYFWALADAFTICDSYHCSVLGPTDPNRLYSMSATIDLKGSPPSIQTQVTKRGNFFGTYTWKTYPEVLQEAGISWKVYQTEDGLLGDNVLTYFKNYQYNGVVPHPENPLWMNAFGSQAFPTDFQAACAAGNLPQVSWVLCSLTQSEHPPGPPQGGENALSTVVNALTSSSLWPKSALFFTYDENGGFFDHVPPPTAPARTPGEYLTGDLTSDHHTGGVLGPIGLGFRVPLLVMSPFSRGGFVATVNPLSPSTTTYDHTSLLRFLETWLVAKRKSLDGVGGVRVPNLSDWRRANTGDLTGVFNFRQADSSLPANLSASNSLLLAPPIDQPQLADQCLVNSTTLVTDQVQDAAGTNVPFPNPQMMPTQEPGSRPQPSGPVQTASAGAPAGAGAARTGSERPIRTRGEKGPFYL